MRWYRLRRGWTFSGDIRGCRGDRRRLEAWEISFNQAGIPIHFEARTQSVEKPVLTWVKFSPYPYGLQTRGYIQGSGSTYSLSKEGERYLDLISPAD